MFMKHKCSSLHNNLLVFLDTINPTLVLVFCIKSFWAFLSLTRSNFCFHFLKSFITSPLHLFFDRPLVLTPIGLWPVILITGVISSILCTWSHHLILCASIYLKLSSAFINFFNLLLLLILQLPLQRSSPNIFLNISLSNSNKLFMSHMMSRFHMHVTIGLINVMQIFLLVYDN